MHYIKISDKSLGFNAEISLFRNQECHIMIEPSDSRASAASCITALENSLPEILIIMKFCMIRSEIIFMVSYETVKREEIQHCPACR